MCMHVCTCVHVCVRVCVCTWTFIFWTIWEQVTGIFVLKHFGIYPKIKDISLQNVSQLPEYWTLNIETRVLSLCPSLQQCLLSWFPPNSAPVIAFSCHCSSVFFNLGHFLCLSFSFMTDILKPQGQLCWRLSLSLGLFAVCSRWRPRAPSRRESRRGARGTSPITFRGRTDCSKHHWWHSLVKVTPFRLP